MRLGRVALLLLASMGFHAMAATIRGGDDGDGGMEERRLQIEMTEDDFDVLGAYYNAEDDVCKVTFQRNDDWKMGEFTLNNNVYEMDDKIICFEWDTNPQIPHKYGVDLDVWAEFQDNVDWIDQDGTTVKTDHAEFRWVERSGANNFIKLTIFKDVKPECEIPHENEHRYFCEYCEKNMKIYRPTYSNYVERDFEVECGDDIVRYFIGTDEKSCADLERDQICDCKLYGNTFSCRIIVSEKMGNDCSFDYVDVDFHGISCMAPSRGQKEQKAGD